MGWNKLTTENDSKEKLEEQRLKQLALAQQCHRVFSSEDGQEFLAHLTNHFVIHNETSLSSPNITYESGYHAGEAGVVKYIIHQMQRAEEA